MKDQLDLKKTLFNRMNITITNRRIPTIGKKNNLQLKFVEKANVLGVIS